MNTKLIRRAVQSVKAAGGENVEAESYRYDGFTHRLRVANADRERIVVSDIIRDFPRSLILFQHESAGECVMEVRPCYVCAR